ncbi:MAG TPA: DUF255 domain-containing protein [Cyclobacteriaceae bacterium]|nr:DUF255 domain-containing protein [Cyclobacteriaceae bacterium]
MKNVPRTLAIFLISITIISGGCIRNTSSAGGLEAAVNELGRDRYETPGDILTPFLKQAEKANKKLFLVFGWKGCSWCRRFEQYHEDSDVREILDKYFIIINIDIKKSQACEDLYKTYGNPGTPSWAILDPGRNVIADSDNLKDGTGNVGYPLKAEEVEYYKAALKTSRPLITDLELTVLAEKLITYGTVKNEK